EAVDLVVHSGDLFDRAIPVPEALSLGLDALVRLASGGRRPVVVVAGNHDSPKLFEALAPVLAPLGVHLVGDLRAPAAGGVVEVETASGSALVSAVPWVSPGKVVDFMGDAGEAFGTLADTMRAIVGAHADHVVGSGSVTVLAAHFMVGGVTVRTGRGPTGMKELTLGEAFAVTKAAVNHDFSYVALGHIHAPQRVPGAPSGEYAGSLLQLDFGEAGETKRVVLVDAEPGRPASVTSVPLVAGRPLVRASGSWEALSVRADLDDAWLDLVVETDGPPIPAQVDEWRERFPLAVKLAAEFETEDIEAGHVVAGRRLDELYADYHASVHGEIDDALAELVRDVADEAER
ncbi:MAG: exonuclease subunit SbcD, partial [Acidimicrobiia bacterium]